MDFRPSDEHLAFQRTVREFAQGEIAPHADEWDLAGRLPVEIVHAMGDLGLFGLPFPEAYGGGGGDFLSLCLAIEEIGRVDQSVGITLSAGRRPRGLAHLPFRHRRAARAVAPRPRRWAVRWRRSA